MKAKDVMTESVITVKETQSVTEVKKILRKSSINGAPVVNDEGTIVGIITVNDLLDAFSCENDDRENANVVLVGSSDVKIKKYMSKNVLSVDAETHILEVFKLMNDNHIHRVVVTSGGELKGIISSTDAYKTLLKIVRDPEEIKKIIEHMRSY
ncbi:MAG: CBS domain-containing protein [Elusimicrobiota bacterium]